MPEAAEPTPLRVLERASKAATTASVFLIVVLQLSVHPDITPVLQAAGAAAFVAGWFAGRRPGARVHAAWILVAPLTPALLRLLTGREGPVLDVIWMAGLAGSLLRAGSWSRWNLPTTWRVLMGGWALTLSLAWPILVGREIGFDLSGLRDFGAINSWAMLSAPQVAAWILYVVLTQLLGLLWLDWLIGRFAETPGRLPAAAHSLWIGATLASLVAVYQGMVDLSFLSTPAWASLGRATGTMLDANAYGVIAALAAPLAFIAVRSGGPYRVYTSCIVLVVNLLGMWMSGSRTALLCGLCGVSALAVSTFVGRGFSRRPSTRSGRPEAFEGRVAGREGPPFGSVSKALATTTIVIGVVAVIAMAGAVGPLQRLADVPLTAEGWSLLWNRGPYGVIAAEMIQEYPVTGVGLGTYHVLAPDYWRAVAGNALPFDNAQNWWRHQTAELGLAGAAPILGWSLLLAWRVVAGRSPSDPAAGMTVRALMIGLGLSSLLGMPTQNPVVLLWLFFLAAWLTQLTGVPGVERVATPRWIAAGSIIVMLTAVGYASGHAVQSRGSLAVVERAKHANRDFVSGAHAAESMESGGEFRWTGRESHFVWAARTRWLVLRVWAVHPDIATRPVRVTISTPCQVVFDEELRSTDSVSIGLQLPEGLRALEGSVRVSRTWQPSAFGGGDTRDLGAGLAAEFQGSRERTLARHRVVEVENCAR